jgi:hypothetical protein
MYKRCYYIILVFCKIKYVTTSYFSHTFYFTTNVNGIHKRNYNNTTRNGLNYQVSKCTYSRINSWKWTKNIDRYSKQSGIWRLKVKIICKAPISIQMVSWTNNFPHYILIINSVLQISIQDPSRIFQQRTNPNEELNK